MILYIMGSDTELSLFSPTLYLVGQNHYHYELHKLRNHECLKLLRFEPLPLLKMDEKYDDKITKNKSNNHYEDLFVSIPTGSHRPSLADVLIGRKFNLPQQTETFIRELHEKNVINRNNNDGNFRQLLRDRYRRTLVGFLTKLNTKLLRRSLDHLYKCSIKYNSNMFNFNMCQVDAQTSSFQTSIDFC